ncbi:MAG: hypothetical protein HIU57_02775 [Acidobacteria bacterium]|nr:hypothetical protein [Acidobacteriota bacterium]
MNPARRREFEVSRRRRTEFLQQKLLALTPAPRVTAQQLATFLESLSEET